MTVFKAVLTAFLLVVPGIAAGGASADQQLTDLLASSGKLLQGHIGFKFVDAQTGEVLAAQNAGQFFTPASNTKLYTTALAMARLGPTYQFKTTVRTSKVLSSGDTSVPDLTLVGGGDPNLSGRVLPYSVSAKETDPLAPINRLADQVVSRGIRAVTGNIIGDDTRYPYDPYPDGWTFDDSLWLYGAPVSALSVHDNSIHVAITPTQEGELAQVAMQPDVGALIVLNKVITDNSDAQHVYLSRTPASNELVITGTIGQRSIKFEQDVAVDDPALFAAGALKRALQDRGVAVLGEATALHRDLTSVPDLKQAPRLIDSPQGTEVASFTSGPLWQAIQVVNKVSQNLHAEMLLREVGQATRSVGTLAAGLEERSVFLSVAAALGEQDYAFADGSGLARQGLTTPNSTVALLQMMWNRPERNLWVESLPIGGFDGTLQHRFKGISLGPQVHAKTGSLSHVSALSGYLQTKGGRWITFSLMANAEVNAAADVQSFFDHACDVFLEQ